MTIAFHLLKFYAYTFLQKLGLTGATSRGEVIALLGRPMLYRLKLPHSLFVYVQCYLNLFCIRSSSRIYPMELEDLACICSLLGHSEFIWNKRLLIVVVCQFSLTLAAVYLSGSKNPYKMTHQCKEREENTVQAILRAHWNKMDERGT